MIVRKTMAKRKPNPTSSMVPSKEHTVPEEQVLSESSGLPSSITEMPEEKLDSRLASTAIRNRKPHRRPKDPPPPPCPKGMVLVEDPLSGTKYCSNIKPLLFRIMPTTGNICISDEGSIEPEALVDLLRLQRVLEENKRQVDDIIRQVTEMRPQQQ